MKPTVIHVRHGATEYDPPVARSDRIAGWMDLPLAPEGRTEAFTVAKFLKDIPIQKIYTSSLDRAKDVGLIIRALKPSEDRPPVEPTDKLKPQDVGKYTDKLEKEVRADLLRYQIDLPGSVIPGGESFNQHKKRFLPFLAEQYEAAKKNPDKGAIVLVHHSRNFPIVKGWWQAGMKGTDVDEECIREGPQVQPGEIAMYEHVDGRWNRRVVPVKEEKRAAG